MNTNSHRRPPRRLGVLAAATALLVLAAACTDDQKRGLGEEDARSSLAGRVERVVDEQGLSLDGDLSCTATIDSDGALVATCTGTGTSSEAISGAYDGTGDIDAETCTAHLVVTVDGATVADEPDVDCFNAG